MPRDWEYDAARDLQELKTWIAGYSRRLRKLYLINMISLASIIIYDVLFWTIRSSYLPNWTLFLLLLVVLVYIVVASIIRKKWKNEKIARMNDFSKKYSQYIPKTTADFTTKSVSVKMPPIPKRTFVKVYFNVDSQKADANLTKVPEYFCMDCSFRTKDVTDMLNHQKRRSLRHALNLKRQWTYIFGGKELIVEINGDTK